MNKCFECDSVVEIHLHHVVPRSKGGKRTIALCAICHGHVHSKKLTSIGSLTKSAMQVMKAQGLYTGGKVPYGKTLNNGLLVNNDYELAIIKRARELKKDGLSLRKVAASLALEGFKARNNSTFCAQQISNMVKKIA